MADTMQRSVPLHFRVFRAEGQWVGRCDELAVSTCADSQAEATEGIIEATSLYLEILQDEGELERVLSERGVAIAMTEPTVTARFWEEQIPIPADG